MPLGLWSIVTSVSLFMTHDIPITDKFVSWRPLLSSFVGHPLGWAGPFVEAKTAPGGPASSSSYRRPRRRSGSFSWAQGNMSCSSSCTQLGLVAAGVASFGAVRAFCLGWTCRSGRLGGSINFVLDGMWLQRCDTNFHQKHPGSHRSSPEFN